MIGSIWAFKRGWLQINAQRYSLGHFPVANFPYSDRSGVFVAGETELHAYVRLFGGGEYAKSNLNPSASEKATVGIPPGNFSRVYGGARFRVTGSSTFTIRVEGGGREIRPSRFSSGFESDTGVVSTEWQGRFNAASLFGRYERRSNVDPVSAGSSYTSHDASGQFYLNLPGGRQLFALAFLTRRADHADGGETLWQAGGGSQLPLGPLYLRVEGTFGRTREWTEQTVTTRQTFSVGLSSRIADRTYLSVDCFVDHSPFLVAGGPSSPWTTRTMIRLTRSMPFGTARSIGRLGPTGTPVYTGASGSVGGIVFDDWNGNGIMDPDEAPVGGITITVGPWGSVVSGADGRFEISGVPVGPQTVALDIASVPADFDAPPADPPAVNVVRNQRAAVAFGLLPLGSIQGVVYQDVDSDGKLSPADTPIDRAVLVLDDGTRTELTRDGKFRFDSVRLGPHTIGLLVASLSEGAQLVGEATVKVELAKDKVLEKVVFLVKMEKREEIRKVFPIKKRGS